MGFVKQETKTFHDFSSKCILVIQFTSGKTKLFFIHYSFLNTHVIWIPYICLDSTHLELKSSFEPFTHHLVNHTFVNHSINLTKDIHCEPHPSWATSMVNYIFREQYLLWTTLFANYTSIMTTTYVNHTKQFDELYHNYLDYFIREPTWTIWWTISYVDYLILFLELHSLLNYLLKIHELCSIWTPWLKFVNYVPHELLKWSS